MRLIGGFLHLDGQTASPERLAAMVAAMVEPGLAPLCSQRIDGPAALFTLDFAAAATPSDGLEPCAQRAGSLALDGRFDLPGDALDEASLAERLERRGVAGLEGLAGDFALAAWNPRDGTLLCARDDFGVRPLFIAHRPGEFFAFASLPRALHASGLVERVIEPGFIADELTYRIPGDGTCLFKGIERVQAAQWVRVRLGAPALERGRHWQANLATAGTRRIAPDAAAAELAWLIENAVQRRLSASGPVAAHLTGGMDSSSIAILAARALRPQQRSLHAYSLVPRPIGAFQFGGNGRYIDPVLRQEPDIVWHPARVDDQPGYVLPAMDRDQLFPVGRGFPEVAVFADAAARGAEVLLSGWGGDDGCSYNQRGVLAEALLRGRWRYLIGELKALGSAQAAWRQLSPYLLPPGMVRLIRRMAGGADDRRDPKQGVQGLMQPRYADGRAQAESHFSPDARRIRHQLISRNIISYRAEKWALLGARHGIAPAFPLLDRHVVEFSLSLPSNLFLREGWPRRLYRDAMAGILPEELRWKPSKQDVNAEGVAYVADQAPFLAEFLGRVRGNPLVGELFDLGRIEARLDQLPSTEALARYLETGVGDPANGEAAHSLLLVFRALSFLHDHA